jgi:hypothetical protein
MKVEAIEAPVYISNITEEVTPVSAEYRMKSPAAVVGATLLTLADR